MVPSSPELKWALARREARTSGLESSDFSVIDEGHVAPRKSSICTQKHITVLLLVVRLPVWFARMLAFQILHNRKLSQLCLDKRFCSCVSTVVRGSNGKCPMPNVSSAGEVGEERDGTVAYRWSRTA